MQRKRVFARLGRKSLGAHRAEQGRGGLSPNRPTGATSPADAGVGGLRDIWLTDKPLPQQELGEGLYVRLAHNLTAESGASQFRPRIDG